MVNRSILFGILIIFYQSINAQEITFKSWNDSIYGALDTFSANAVADDFGARRCCGNTPRNFHGGLDYNSFQNTGGNGNNDLWDMILAPEDGTIVDVNRLWTSGFNYKQLCYEAGNHRYIFGHVYDNTGSSYVENDSTVILKQMIPRPTNPNEIKWAQLLLLKTQSLVNNTFVTSIDTFVYGQVLGNVEWNGDTLTTTTTVTAGDPIAPLGESAANGAAHLHLNTIPLNQNHSTGITTYNSNPLQYIDYKKASYDIKLYSQGDTNGIHIVYPGTAISPLATRVKMNTTVSGIGDKRYDHIFDINKVQFVISSSNYTDTLIQGPAKQSIIDLGGKLNDTITNHPNPQFGSWTTTGINSIAYNAGYPHMPFDIYHYSDFVTKIHKNDPMDGSTTATMIAECPDSTRYPDGRYDIFANVIDIRDDEFQSDTLSFTLDNWKPYIKDVLIYIGDSLVYDEEWTCNGNCVEFSNRNLSTELKGVDLENEMEVFVTTSEPLVSLSLSIPEFGLNNLALSTNSDSIIWAITIESDSLANSPNKVSLEFSGSDMSNNQLISFPTSATGDCFSIPFRDSAVTFDDPNATNLTYGVDDIHGFQLSCAAIDSLKGGQINDSRNSSYQTIININSPDITTDEIIVNSYCHPECNNGSINIQVDNPDEYNIVWSTGDTKFDIYNLGAGSYSYTITDNLCGYLDGTVELECNQIAIQFETTGSCDNDGTIEATVFGGIAPYSFFWLDDLNETANIRTNLGSNLYTLEVTDDNGCSNAASVFVKNLDAIVIEDMEYVAFNANCNANDGALQINTLPSGGLPPFSYELSNGDSGQLASNNWTAIYNLAAGDYTITISDEVGCSASEEFEIGVEGLPDVAINNLEHTCEGEENGLIGLEFTIYTINWSNGETGNIISDLAQGIYYYTVTDTESGCTGQESIEIEVLDANSEPIMAVSDSDSTCPGLGSENGKISLTVSGGVPPYSYIWSNGSNSKNIQNLSKGDYSVTITDKCGLTGVFSEYVDATEILSNIDWELNFGEISITTDPDGGVAPYSYQWGNGATSQGIEVTEEGAYKVTITDTNGCLVEEVIDIAYNCEPLAIALKSTPEGYDCNLAVILGFESLPGNSFLEGTAPFKIKIEKQINQEWIILENKIINSLGALSQYQYYSTTSGTYRTTVIDNCGDTFEEIYKGCLDCNYEFYTGGGDNDEVYVDIFQGMITLEQVCPCEKDCDFGFTHDKIKLYVDEDAIENSNLPWNQFNFTIIWPDADVENTVVTKSWIGNEQKIKVYGPTEYVLSDDEFDNGVNVSVEYFLVKDGTLNLQCQTDIPFKGGQLGYNGAFFYFLPANINPFSNSGFVGPYFDGNFACSTACEIPLETGVLYANQPEEPYDVIVDCEVEDIVNYFRFRPLDFADPCFGGGYLRTLVEGNGGIYLNEIFIPANTALAQANWNVDLPLDGQGLYCDAASFDKGYCLFEGIDVYGVETIRHLIAPYCKEELFIPIIDSDDDGIPNDEDPCPYVFGVFCDDANDGEDDLPNWNPGSGCIALFEEEQCLVNIVCEDGPTTTVYGTISEEFYSGSEPCYHCFSADVCRIPNPQGGPDFVSIVGNINDMLSVSLLQNELGCDACGSAFFCGVENQLLGIICDDNCPPSIETLIEARCTLEESGDEIALQGNQDDPPSYKQNQKISKDAALAIIKTNQIYDEPSIKVISIPNPSDEVFDLQVTSNLAGKGMIQIINVLGEFVYNKEIAIDQGKNLYRIDTNFNTGLYYITISVNKKIEQTIKHVVY